MVNICDNDKRLKVKLPYICLSPILFFPFLFSFQFFETELLCVALEPVLELEARLASNLQRSAC